MQDTTKYDKLVNLFLDNWIIAVIVLLLVVVAFIPNLKDGLKELYLIRKIFKRKFVIIKNGEKITFELKTQSAFFDIVKINAVTHHLGVSAEYQWIEKYYRDYKTRSQSLSKFSVDNQTSLYFDTHNIFDDKGNKKVIYFDISSFYNDGGHTSSNLDKFAREKIKQIFKTNNGA